MDKVAGLGRVLTLLGYAVAVVVFTMMAITFVDVVGRQLPPALGELVELVYAELFGRAPPKSVAALFASRPLTAAFELTRLALGMMVFVALPLVTANDEHVTIGLLNPLFPGRAGRIKRFVVTLLVAILCVAWASELWIQAAALTAQNERLMFLGIRLAPFVYVMSAMTALAALVALVQSALKLGGGYAPEPRAEI